ncbi:DUF2635 domain-containing protein [Achromobacter denitrificans]|jgi:hypothetical protein|uniref:DUF2635 domain-containing protein n=1 Tax=Achromobacter TaxID=222 RepID=UPI0006BF526D|nr:MULTISPECIES: DUF2635 domain-containing protein [Achromobacter]MDF3939583.1 DUF2635 domain-containing protein [Achromobacter denitrificans]QCS64424.1 DUF2635 domain-containing protein [Achromobacter denitrificans]QQE57468.1 DUF2635 domain-containing protein [Achromobacter xylosoxidans]QQV17107.1 DUF2635 domain-containing protein [Achromobacter xylosoxidans]WFC70378.1 DUF2635 domain-containing protein [Achromobacter denitrificans]
MYIKPRPGLKVFDPVRKQFMPDEGMPVDENDLYWAARMRDGDVVEADAPGARTSTTNEVPPALPNKGASK